LLSFRGRRVHVIRSVLSPGSREKIRIHKTLLTREDHGGEIVFAVANFGRIPFMVSQGDCVGQVVLIGVDDVACQVLDDSRAEICFEEPACALVASATTDDVMKPGYQYNPKPYEKAWVGNQSAGEPEATKLYDPDAPMPEPAGVLRPIASRVLVQILRAARMCRYDLLRAVCGLGGCATKSTHQCDNDLPRLICNINATKDHSMIGWCGDPDAIVDLRVYADADFAGCVRAMRSAT
jgi:hypothetical protein